MVAVRRSSVCSRAPKDRPNLDPGLPRRSSCALTLEPNAWKPPVKQEKKLTRGIPWFGTFSPPGGVAGVEELLSRIKRPQAPNYAPARASIERMLGQKSHTPPDHPCIRTVIRKGPVYTRGIRYGADSGTIPPHCLDPSRGLGEQTGRRGLLRLGGT